MQKNIVEPDRLHLTMKYGNTQGSATSSQGIRGYISVMDDLKFTYFVIK